MLIVWCKTIHSQVKCIQQQQLDHLLSEFFAERIKHVPRSFIREILTIALQDDVISFAGGLPNPSLFPVKEIQQASADILAESGAKVLQYGASQGDINLRKWISQRYLEKQGLEIHADNILITSGSQQALDLIGKVLINEGDKIAIESPGYLGAIQAFSLFQPEFISLPINEQGLDISELEVVLNTHSPKLIYTVPNFQNPSGISHSESNKQAVAEQVKKHNTLIIDDDPYGELRFSGKPTTPYWQLLPDQTILLGSFSKIIAPGMRLGWVAAPKNIIDKLLIAKQASDLHTSLLTQGIIHQFLKTHSLDAHISTITDNYGKQCDAMLNAINQYFPDNVKTTKPEGGMFLWVTLPDPLTAKAVFEGALKEKVVFVPGDPFYINPININTLRLNYSCADEVTVDEGIKRIGKVIQALLDAL